MPFSSSKRKPLTPVHPGLMFHVVRSVQLLCSVIVAGVMFYFIHHLRVSDWRVPWMFFFLQGSAITTLLCLAISTILLFYRPSIFTIFTLITDSLLSIFWIVGFSLLADAMRWTLLRQCTHTLWGSDQGVLLCALYKLLFSASLVATLATIAAVAVNLSNRRADARVRGKYVELANSRSAKVETEYVPASSAMSGRDTLYDNPEAPRIMMQPPSPAGRLLPQPQPAGSVSRSESPSPLLNS